MDVSDLAVIIPSYLNGGSEKFGIKISKYLSNYRKVSLISLKDVGILKKEIKNSKKLMSQCLGSNRNRYKLFTLFKILKEQKVVFSVMRDTNIFCLICAFFLPKLKIIIREGNRLNKLNYIKIFFLNLLYYRANKIIVNSNDIKKDIDERFFLIKNKVIVLFNPIYKYQERRRPKIFEKVILNVSRFHEQKNHTLLIDSFFNCLKKNQNLKLILVGSGHEEDKIKKKVNHLNLKEKVLILKPMNDLDDIYQKADLYVHTSLYEGFPNVIAEAISNSLYCITTPSSSSLNEIIFDKNFGHITATFEAKELSEVILKSLNLSGYDNSRFVKKFFIDFYGKNFLNVLDDICV